VVLWFCKGSPQQQQQSEREEKYIILNTDKGIAFLGNNDAATC
jgi:hypothetical protein